MKLGVDGMMSEACEQKVEKALLSVPGVETAVVSATEASAVVTFSGNITDVASKLVKAVNSTGKVRCVMGRG